MAKDNNDSKIIVSGIKPTGRPHLGNYFGAMRQMIERQDEYLSYIFLADLHALTTVREAKDLRADSLDLAIDYLAVGLDPARTILFKQSDILEHTQLNWIFNCLATVPYLSRAHAFKDAIANGKEATVGLFDYPLLMAADILLYDADLVPVGQDQKQHVEYARDMAEKFNFHYGETFKLPEALILNEVMTVPGLDGRKMSKSYGNHIPLFASDEELKKLVASIVTDSKGVEESKDPEACNVFALHKLVSQKDLPELRRRYLEGGIGYKESKDVLLANLIAFIGPLREKREQFASNPDRVKKILAEGAEKAKAIAEAKMALVRERVGLE